MDNDSRDDISAGDTPSTDGAQQNNDNSPRQFTQSDIERIAGRARAAERAKYADYDELKVRAEKADELERANMTEAQRKETMIAELQRKTIDAETKIAEMAINSDIRVRASQRGFVDPNDAVALINRSGIGYSDSTGVSGVADALAALMSAKAHLLTPNSHTPNINAHGGAAPPVAKALSPLEKEAARLLTISEDDYSSHSARPNAPIAPSSSG